MPTNNRAHLFAFLGILFLALNLRGPFTSVAPVLGQIMQDLSLSPSAAGILTSLPLLSFAFFSPMAAGASRKFGLFPSLLLALIAIALGIATRSMGHGIALYLGTVLIGIGIAAGNVLLPVVVKVSFPGRISAVTALYVFTMNIGSTLGAGLMVPLSHLGTESIAGWQLALAFNLLFPILALTIWLPKVLSDRGNVANKQKSNDSSMLQLLRCPVARQITLAIGLNSFTFYSFAGWLPKMLNDLSYSELDAGYIYSFLQFSTMIPGLILVPILSRTNSQRGLITLCTFSVFIAVIGLLLLPAYAILWVGLFGLANCATFVIGISFVGLRTSSPSQAAALSGLAQSIGYGLAATGPTVLGYINTLTESWTLPLLIISVMAFLCMVFANLAARDKKVLQGKFDPDNC